MIPGVRLIYVDGTARGLVGLDEIYGEVGRHASTGADQLAESLVEAAARRNYIPDPVRAKYAAALLLDYRLWRGDISTDEARRAAGVVEVRVLGSGCPRCDLLEALTLEILAEIDEQADVLHIRDQKEIASYGLVALPALVINGRLVVGGHVPGRAALAERIRRALDEAR
jgi:hypothetical protein